MMKLNIYQKCSRKNITNWKCFLCILSIKIITLIFGSSAWSKESEWSNIDVNINMGIKSGYITYQIGGFFSSGGFVGRTHFPLSELKFPRNFETVQLGITIKGENGWNVLMELEANASKNSGLLEDSDWLTQNKLDIYSETKTSVSAQEFLLEASNEFSSISSIPRLSGWDSRFGFGVLGQLYDYRGYDTTQSYPSNNNPTIFIAGDTITFKFTQITPFASYSISRLFTQKLQLNLKVILSPFVFINDKDRHLKRNKMSVSNTRGWLFDSSVKLYWHGSQALFFYAQLSFQQFEANGSQEQTFEGSPTQQNSQVKIKHLGRQSNLKAGVNWRF